MMFEAYEAFDVLVVGLSGLFCLMSLGCLAAVLYYLSSAGGSSKGAPGGGDASTAKAAPSGSPLGGARPAQSARLDPPDDTRPTEVAPSGPRARPNDEVFDYDEDGPTTLFEPVELNRRLAEADSSTPNLARGVRPQASSGMGQPPSQRRALLGHVDVPTLDPLMMGATIVPPDEYDFIDEEEADETMVMTRPPLPPKKK